MNQSEALKYCKYYKREKECPSELNKTERQIWVAEQWICSQSNMIDSDNPERNFVSLVAARLGNWKPREYFWEIQTNNDLTNLAKSADYLYVHICVDDGWGRTSFEKAPRFAALCDIEANTVKFYKNDSYLILNKDNYEFIPNIIFNEIDSVKVNEDFNLQKMFEFEEKRNWYDVGGYSIYMQYKNMTKSLFLFCGQEHTKNYEPFKWLLNFLEKYFCSK